MFNDVQEAIKTQFDNTANTIKTIKKASEILASSSMFSKTPNLVGKSQAQQAPQPAAAAK